eukprot:733340-Pyramimonas_sp.AAC.1
MHSAGPTLQTPSTIPISNNKKQYEVHGTLKEAALCKTAIRVKKGCKVYVATTSWALCWPPAITLFCLWTGTAVVPAR